MIKWLKCLNFSRFNLNLYLNNYDYNRFSTEEKLLLMVFVDYKAILNMFSVAEFWIKDNRLNKFVHDIYVHDIIIGLPATLSLLFFCFRCDGLQDSCSNVGL